METRYDVIGENHVAVPTHLFKVILVVPRKETLPDKDKHNADQPHFMAAFLVPNTKIGSDKHLLDFVVPLDQLEKYTGIYFICICLSFTNF